MTADPSDDDPEDNGEAATDGTTEVGSGAPDSNTVTDAGPDEARNPNESDHDPPGDRAENGREFETETPPDRDGPLGDIADEVADRMAEGTESPADQLFEEVDDVGEIDREALWRQVAGEDILDDIEPRENGVTDHPPGGPSVRRPGETTAADGVTVEERHERVIDKAKYCHGCEYFSAPPDVHCTHEGTDIIELVDVDHFRVVNCPIVKEDEELENV